MLKRLFRSLGGGAGDTPRRVSAATVDAVPDTTRPYVGYVVLASQVMWVSAEGAYKSGLASTRLRSIIPAQHLAREFPVAFVPLESAATGPGALASLGRLRAMVITKFATPDVVNHEPELESLLDWLDDEGRGLRVCADLSDDYAAFGREMGHPYPARYQARLGERCEIVVPCDALARRLEPYAKRGVRVIEDPWETPAAAAPRFAPGETLRLAWFGNIAPMSVEGLVRGLGDALQGAEGRQVRLELVAGAQRADVVEGVLARLAEARPGLETVFTHWSIEATRRAIADADLVLLPQDAGNEWAMVKSHNRLVETLRGGRLAIASDIPSYRELDAYAWVGDDLGAGVRWALDHPHEAAARIAAGQRYVETRFSPAIVGRKWADALLGAGTA